jgi:hypothetical protein
MNCNVCDQLAAEMGELLLKQKQAIEAVEGESHSPEKNQKLYADLKAARQKLIDHMRLIHASA